MRHGYWMLAGAWMLAGIASTGLAADNAATFRQVVAEGAAELSGANDSVQVTAAVVTENADLEKASDQNNRRSTAVTDALKALRVEHLKLRTTDYRVSIQRNYAAGHTGEITGYQVSNAVEATLEGAGQPALAGDVSRFIAAALGAGANEIRQVRFYLKEREVLEQQALTLAASRAMARAAALAAAAGVKLGRLHSISSQPQNASPVVAAGMMRAAAAASAPPVESGESPVAARVVVVYEVE